MDKEILLTSDPHLLHQKVALFRGFKTVEEHDEWVMEGFRTVTNSDTVLYIVGDLCGGGAAHTERALEMIDTLPGEKHFVTGNHDETHPANAKAQKRQRRWLEVFDSVNPFAQIRTIIGGRRRHLSVSHFPYSGDAEHAEEDRFLQWRLREDEAWLLHGHTHRPHQRRHDGRQIHIGLDAWNIPVSMSVIEKIILRYEEEHAA